MVNRKKQPTRKNECNRGGAEIRSRRKISFIIVVITVYIRGRDYEVRPPPLRTAFACLCDRARGRVYKVGP